MASLISPDNTWALWAILYKMAAMMTGSYIGGGVNFVAMTQSFKQMQSGYLPW